MHVNGWKIDGMENMEALENNPSLFNATKGNQTITLAKTCLIPGFKVNENFSMGEICWWTLIYNGTKVSYGRSFDKIFEKAKSLMEQK